MQIFTSLEIENKFYNKPTLFLVSGLLPHLQENFIQELVNTIKQNFVYSKRNNSDIQKYINSLSMFNLEDEAYSFAGLEFTLQENGFEKTSKVETVSEYSTKGDSITFWPIGYEHPIRVSYFGDEIEYIEIYDEVYNTKIKRINSVAIGDIAKLPDKIDWYEIKISGNENFNPNLVLLFSHIQFDEEEIIQGFYITRFNFDFTYPQLFYKRFDLLNDYLKKLEDDNWKIFIHTRHKNEIPVEQRKYLIELEDNGYQAGFSSQKLKMILLTDRELFGTIFLQKERKDLTTKQAQKILEKLEGEIELDDYVVHEDHGIGIYKGIKQEKIIETKTVDFQTIKTERLDDYLLIQYAKGDELLVPISQIQKITKYIGTTEEDPDITRLHKGNWKRTVKKTKKSIELIARDLVQHYAKVQLAKAEKLNEIHTEFYKSFVQAFPYEETEDQKTTIKDILQDLSSEKPMDRLIVGDVGFGKTEVAMRAAFKIIETGKQVAVLCPTTVLAAQHFKVFKERFENFGINVNYVSRFHTPSVNKTIIKEAKKGSLDILVGTHRLLSNDVEFKNLGLIVIDEEQKFGVKQKEKIKKLQYTAHSLAMTATPIPRTLSMALSQIKDISIIATPPDDRRSIKTEVAKLDWTKIVFQIENELKRGGQVYFIHNRVETIESIRARLQKLLPDIRFIVGHGQMSSRKLDEAISMFYDKKYDVLICTTIIENGIDMPNVNTIIINNGQNFGLGQLYQLRGRVGRSEKQAYCYIYYKGDELSSSSVETQVDLDDEEIEAIQRKRKNQKYKERLRAIVENQELGSGFKLASRDLEIRGAGNLLGKQQHGNIQNVGLALYMQMLAEAIEKQKLLDKYQADN
ncbi:DEAD/DEAH box helicase [Candidatus Dojkabacteria bacterium]|nr:DEAD/DEAH box helicase [Candidatus Dojkabacteria bacterium]